MPNEIKAYKCDFCNDLVEIDKATTIVTFSIKGETSRRARSNYWS